MSGTPPKSVGRNESGVAEVFAEQLRLIAQARGREQRARTIDDLSALVQATDSAAPFLARLAGADRHGQRLALEIVMRMPAPLPEAVCGIIVPILTIPRFRATLRLNVAIQVLRSLPEGSSLVGTLLAGLVSDVGPTRSVERLKFLSLHLPNQAELEKRTRELEKQSTIACPRCGVRLQRAELVVHLWQTHRLLMEGSRARDPWKMIEDWLTEYANTGRRDLFERSCELGQQLDPIGGLTRVHRSLLAAGLTDDEAQENLTAQAEGVRASLCPHCYALVPPEHDPLPQPMNLSRGRLAGNGWTVEVSDRYLFTRLYSASPDRILHNGLEPRHRLTRRGQALLQVGPLVTIAFLTSLFLPTSVLPPLTPVALILLAALFWYFRVRLRHSAGSDPRPRAIDHAWRYLAPEMHRPKFSRKDARFLARLAVTSIGIGSPQAREPSLERILKLTRPQAIEGKVPIGDLVALHCLEIDDAIRLGHDSIPLFVNELTTCLAGELPLIYGEQLLEAWPSETHDRAQRARLRVLLCARAFELGFEGRDLRDLGRFSNVFGQAYASEDLIGLLRLRWLWNNRPARVWQRYGSASTVFDLARFPALCSQYLESRADLLLFQPMTVGGSDSAASSPILICEEGVVYRDIVIKDPDTPIVVKGKAVGEYELQIGKTKLRFDEEPALLARRLKGWTHFLFRVLLPSAKGLADKRTPAKITPLRAQKTLICPECGNSFLALRGEVGVFAEPAVV